MSSLQPRMVGIFLLLLQCVTTATYAFHINHRVPSAVSSSSNARLKIEANRVPSKNAIRHTCVDFSGTGRICSSLQAMDDENAEGESSSTVPFFSRLAKRLSGKPKDAASAALEDLGGVAVAIKEEQKQQQKEGQATPEELAAQLKLQAERARLEAQKMDAMLTIEKISKLEKQLEGKGLKDEEQKNIRRQINVLNSKLDGADGNAVASVDTSIPTSSSVASTEESITQPAESADEDISSMIVPDESKKSPLAPEVEKMIPPISDEELKLRSEAFRKTPKVLQQMTAAAAGFKDTNDVERIIRQMHRDEQLQLLKKEAREDQKAEPLTDEAREQALEGYMKLPLPIQEMIARSAGMENGKNATEVIARLEKDGRLLPNEDGMQAGFEVTTDVVGSKEIDVIFQDMEKMEKDKYIESMLPRETRKVDGIPTDEDIGTFFKLLGNRNFNPTGKPEIIPGGFLIRGENKLKDGDELVATLEKALSATNITDKVQFCYIKDPNPSSEEEFQNYQNDLPVLMVTGRDFSPETKFLTKAAISLIGVVFVASFSVGALSFNEVLVNRLDAEVQAGTADLSWVQSIAAPTFFAVMVTQLVHEMSHQVVALKDKFKAGLPTIVPSLQTGLSGAVTPLKSPPPNLKSLFDFSMAGPLSGLIISLFFMYSGLELTAFVGPDAASQLPSLPLSLVRSSALAGGMVEWLLGEGILAQAPNAGGTVLLHPFAIAGFVGLISNSLALLPIGNTDGGRISQTLFGRKWARVISGLSLFILVLSGLFGLDESNILLSYVLLVTVWQRNPEIPCANEVDDVDLGRVGLAILGAMLATLTLLPLP